MRIALLHTAQIHETTFDALFSALGSEITVTHRVEPALLERARAQGVDAVRAQTLDILHELSSADAVICTCSTLGPLADEVSRTLPHVFRIDRPLMEGACKAGRTILVAVCLESTRQATLDLLADCAAAQDHTIAVHPVVIGAAWPFFEAGDMPGFANAIAAAISAEVAAKPNIDCIVLAQASMRVAEPALAALGIAVLSSPLLAAEHSIAVAKART